MRRETVLFTIVLSTGLAVSLIQGRIDTAITFLGLLALLAVALLVKKVEKLVEKIES